MNQNRRHLVARDVVASLLACAYGAFHHGIDHFEVGRIERERDVHIAAGRPDIRRKPLVVLDVARTLHVVRVVATLEFREQRLRRLADYVDQHVEAAAMRHADHDFLDAALPALLNQVVQHRNEAVAALEGETFLRRIFRGEVEFQPFGGGELT